VGVLGGSVITAVWTRAVIRTVVRAREEAVDNATD
jgi:hypothetical protein